MMSIQSEFSKRKKSLLVKTPIELSRLIDYFKKENKENFVSALVVGPRKRDFRLAAPAKFTTTTKKMRVATILLAEILKIKTKYTHYELRFVESKTVKQPMLK